jgi:hypothetical protein
VLRLEWQHVTLVSDAEQASGGGVAAPASAGEAFLVVVVDVRMGNVTFRSGIRRTCKT